MVLAVTVVSSGLPALEPLGHRAIFDRLGGAARYGLAPRLLAWPSIFLVALWALRYVFDLVSALIAWRARLDVHRDLLAEATARLHRLPLAYHQGRGVGETMTRFDRGIGSLMEALAQLTFQAIPSIVYIVVSALIMLQLSPLLTLIAAAFIVPPTLLGRVRTGKIVARERAGLDQWCTIYGHFQQVLAGIRVVKAFGREPEEHARFLRSVTAAQDEALGSMTVGVQLSGGERQRVAIARTLLRDPAIVLLDEPTSSLDVEGEIAVQDAIERLAAGRTTLLIAHRLAATTRASRLVVLEEGRIVEEGSPAELLRWNGRYRRMMRLWQGWVPRMIQEGLAAEARAAAPMGAW